MKKLNFGMLIIILCGFELVLYLGMAIFTLFPDGKAFFLNNYNEMIQNDNLNMNFDELFTQLRVVFFGAVAVLIIRFVLAIVAYVKKYRIILMILIGLQVMFIVIYFSLGSLPLVIFEGFIVVSLMVLNKQWLIKKLQAENKRG